MLSLIMFFVLKDVKPKMAIEQVTALETAILICGKLKINRSKKEKIITIYPIVSFITFRRYRGLHWGCSKAADIRNKEHRSPSSRRHTPRSGSSRRLPQLFIWNYRRDTHHGTQLGTLPRCWLLHSCSKLASNFTRQGIYSIRLNFLSDPFVALSNFTSRVNPLENNNNFLIV